MEIEEVYVTGQIFLMFYRSILEGFQTQPQTPEVQQNYFY